MSDAVTLFLGGDVMTGRGIDQILPFASDPHLIEPFVRDARDYVAFAEREHGPIPRPAPFSYVWGDALAELERHAPAARIVNLETSVTAHDEYWPAKGINYRMSPRNVPCLQAAELDCCVLANNQVLDFCRPGLLETLRTLRAAGIQIAGAGADRTDAEQPALVQLSPTARLLVFAFGVGSSGIPHTWAANARESGIALLRDLSTRTVEAVAERVAAHRAPHDLVVVSLHWGGNWGYGVPEEHVAFARGLVRAGVDLVYGHSSHHPRPIEIFQRRLILYGCGDLIDDYEGIGGYEEYRSDLVLLYFPTLSATGELEALRLTPLKLSRFRLQRATRAETDWLLCTLNRECASSAPLLEGAGDGLALGL